MTHIKVLSRNEYIMIKIKLNLETKLINGYDWYLLNLFHYEIRYLIK